MRLALEHFNSLISLVNHFNNDKQGLGKKYSHIFVRHGEREFTVGSYSTNGIEGFWGHFKRVIFGTYHFVSKAYLERYIDEAVFRFNTKEMDESARFAHMFRKSIGKCDYKAVCLRVFSFILTIFFFIFLFVFDSSIE